jgi:hypothetical protein
MLERRRPEQVAAPDTIHDDDLIVVRSQGMQFHVWQMVEGRRRHVDGPLAQDGAMLRARKLATIARSRVFIELAPGRIELLER